jgi:DNA helicase-2/ATP-dependent DNA helicase PcrA
MAGLNHSQLAVINCRSPRIVVLAGAGTGKTATSVHWVAQRLLEAQTPTCVMMLTFTRKAAEEMSQRVQALLRQSGCLPDPNAILAGTYHAVASHLMRRRPADFGLRDARFTVLDDSEQQSLWKTALKQCGHNTKSPEWIPTKIAETYSLARNRQLPTSEILDQRHPGLAPQLERVIAAYEKLKSLANSLDYDDLLTRWLQALRDNPQLSDHLRRQYTHVLVDEMQDNNRLNAAILRAMNPHHLLIVGDINQSIYRFRGADPHALTEFLNTEKQTTILRLQHNYRSGQAILDLANTIIADTPTPLHLTSARGTPGTVSARIHHDTGHEVADLIKWLRQKLSSGQKPEDCAILARSSQTLEPLEAALTTAGIRYKKYGGLTLADAAEIKDFLAFLRVSENPRDRVALLRALTQFPGIGETTAAQFFAALPPDGSLPGPGLWPAAARQMHDWLRDLRAIDSLPRKGEYLLEKITPLITAHYPKDAPERLETLNVLINSMRASPLNTTDFLDTFQLSRHADTRHSCDCITLSTIHSAKGLEWKNVWLIGCGDAQMPHPRAANDAYEFAEELRLFYVAVTRARDELVLSYPATTRRGQPQSPTPFAPDTLTWQKIERTDPLEELSHLLPKEKTNGEQSLLVQLFLAQK